MSLQTRRIVLIMSAPVVAFVLAGGVLSKVTSGQGVYQDLKMFNDVFNLISSNYVEKVDLAKVMRGAMDGLADSLDPDSAYLSADQVKQIESGVTLPAGDVGLDLTRQYYLRVIAARDGSPAAKAGLQTGDFIRVIDGKPTREMSVWEGMRALRGAPGTKVRLTVFRGSANDPHDIELTREVVSGAEVTHRLAAPGVGYVRIASFSARTADAVKAQIGELTKAGATRLIIDVRRTSGGSLDAGLALARLFVRSGTLAMRETKGSPKEAIAAKTGDGIIALPVQILADTGTSSAAELFASALLGNKRAEIVGEHTIGRAATQRLIKLPDGTGLYLTTTRYLTPDGTPLHEKGLAPTLAVDQPDVEFGQLPPTSDPVLEKALERAAAGVAGDAKKAA
ncbi:MAG: S41 family peptidase [Vicinamibacterales bacterium]